MTFPTSAARGFFEILMPGVFLVVNIAATVFLALPLIMVGPEQIASAIGEYLLNPAWTIALLFVFGYLVGVVLRLLKNAHIDEQSALYIAQVSYKGRLHGYPLGVLLRLLGIFRRDYRAAYADERRIADGSNTDWLTDDFFYGNWMARKCGERLPKGVAEFYDEYWKDKYFADQKKNTTFFNLCKSVIVHADDRCASDIYGSEALLRFVAGSYYALKVSLALMILNIVCTAICFPGLALLGPTAVFFAYLYLVHAILLQYRFLRCKEVDTVFHACFVNREKFDNLFPTSELRRVSPVGDPDASPSMRRRDLLLGLWQASKDRGAGSGFVGLSSLLQQMKTETKKTSYLSSLYFAGADVDHPFFLKNDKVAVGLAVLPEDAAKAANAKQHPHQTEVIIVLQGSLRLLCRPEGETEEHQLKEGDHFVIPKKVCHWIEPVESVDAAYMFVKTDPAKEPREKPCAKNGKGESV